MTVFLSTSVTRHPPETNKVQRYEFFVRKRSSPTHESIISLPLVSQKPSRAHESIAFLSFVSEKNCSAHESTFSYPLVSEMPFPTHEMLLAT